MRRLGEPASKFCCSAMFLQINAGIVKNLVEAVGKHAPGVGSGMLGKHRCTEQCAWQQTL
jgi:hypothetical protein